MIISENSKVMSGHYNALKVRDCLLVKVSLQYFGYMSEIKICMRHGG